MTTTEVLKTVQGATVENTFPVGDVLTFRALSVHDVVAMLRAAKSVAGEGPSFTVDGYISIVIDEDGITVLGVEV